MRSKDNSLFEDLIEKIDQYFDRNGRSPSIRDLEKLVGVSKSTIQRYLQSMSENGEIESDGHRGIITPHIKELLNTTRVAIGNTIPCGPLSDVCEDEIEHMRLPVAFTGRGEFFILKTRGNSMINAGIDSGDRVMIRRQETADEGQIVAFLYQNEQTTLKTFHRVSDNEVHLIPENDDMDPIVIKGSDLQNLQIQGVATMILKDLG